MKNDFYTIIKAKGTHNSDPKFGQRIKEIQKNVLDLFGNAIPIGDPTCMILGDMTYSNSFILSKRMYNYFTENNVRISLLFGDSSYKLCLISANEFPNYCRDISPSIKNLVVLIPESHTLSAIAYYVFEGQLRESGIDFMFPLVALTQYNQLKQYSNIDTALTSVACNYQTLEYFPQTSFNAPNRDDIHEKYWSDCSLPRYYIDNLILKSSNGNTTITVSKHLNTLTSPTHFIALYGKKLETIEKNIIDHLKPSRLLLDNKKVHPPHINIAVINLTSVEYYKIQTSHFDNWEKRLKTSVTESDITVTKAISELKIFGSNELVYTLDLNTRIRNIVLKQLSKVLGRVITNLDSLNPHISLGLINNDDKGAIECELEKMSDCKKSVDGVDYTNIMLDGIMLAPISQQPTSSSYNGVFVNINEDLAEFDFDLRKSFYKNTTNPFSYILKS